MSREKASYRDNLERVDAAFAHEWLTATEVARWLGVKPETVRKHITFGQGQRISKADLARQIST